MSDNYVLKPEGVATREACLRECALHGGSDDPDTLRKRQAVKTMLYNASGGACVCTTTDWLDPSNDEHIEHFDDTNAAPEVYRVQFCAGVAGGSSRSVVYRKQTNASADPLPVCHGMPVGAGMILSNGSIFFSEDPGSVTRPVDLQCRATCDANPDCAIAHSMIETFEYHQLAHAKPPPPSPPAPPRPPPPIVPPLPPMPPAPPPDGTTGFRAWSPSGYNSAPEGSDDASDGLFHIYCGFAWTDADGAAQSWRASIHSSLSQTSVLHTARKLIDQGTYASSVCPFECTRSILRHGVGATNEANLLSGAGLEGEAFLYPGHADSARGFARLPAPPTAPTPTPPGPGRARAHGAQRDPRGGDAVGAHQLLAPHAVWLVNADAQVGPEARPGEAASSWARARASTPRSGAPFTPTRG